ncbi:hypothetical protein MLD52_11220 [Puniceicoccaceae bacterium K14]|nr:hypothetical protein [Puniceicoccaceae bacterium K14]
MADAATKELVLQIENALKGDIGGHEAAKLAWSYADAVESVNAELMQCADLFADGNVLEAFVKIRLKPRLLERMSQLRFDGLKAWNECCAFLGWRKAEPLKEDLARFLTESLEDIADPKEILIKAFREERSSSDPLKSLLVLKTLCSEYPNEKDYLIERDRLITRCQEDAERKLQKIGDVSKNQSAAKELIEKCLSNGLAIEEAGKRFITTEELLRVEAANECARGFISKAKSYDSGSDWHSHEREFLACDCLLDRLDAHEKIDAKDKESLGEVSSHLYSLRGSYEVNLQIRNTLSTTSGKKRKKKLERLMAHANVMGYEIDEQLRSELSSVDVNDEENSSTLLITFLGILLPMLVVAGWIYKGVVLDVPEYSEEVPTIAEISDVTEASALEQASEENEEDVSKIDSTTKVVEDLVNTDEVVARVEPEIVEELPVDPEYVELLEQFRALVAEEYTGNSDEKLLRIRNEAKVFEEVDQENYRDIGIEFAALYIEYEMNKEKCIKELETLADFSILEAKRLSDELELATSEQQMDSQIESVEAAIEKAYKATNDAKEVQPGYQFDGLEGAEESLYGAKQSVEFLRALREELRSCRSLESYYSLLGGLAEYSFVSKEERDLIATALANRLDMKEAVQRMVLPDRPDDWEQLKRHDNYMESSVMPSPDELSAMMELAHEPFFTSVYISTFQYYQGGYEPQGERLVYLSEPIQKIGEEKDGSANITFKEYGFDEDGNPHNKPRNLNYIKRESGEVFGFYYEPSVLSPESQYFVDVVQATLDDAMSGATRSGLIGLLQSIASQTNLPPMLKAYWSLSLFEIVDANSFKWGTEFSPALERFSNLAKKLARNEVTRNAWLRVEERRNPSIEWINYFEDFLEADPLSEMLALADVFNSSSKGAFSQVGFVKMDGEAHFCNDSASVDDILWSFDIETSSIERYRDGDPLPAYSILLSFEYQGGSIETIKRDIEAERGVDVDDIRFADRLPPLFVP